MWRYFCGFSLNNLRPAHFQTFRSDAGIIRHILCLKWGNAYPFIDKNAAHRRCNNTFSHIGAGSKHRKTRGLLFIFQCQLWLGLLFGNNV